MLLAKGHNVRVINAGISGATTSGGLARLEWVMKSNPKIVVIALGANDGLRGRPVEKMRENLDNMIRYAKDNGAKVVLAGMRLPTSYGKAYREDYEAAFSSLAEEHQLVFIPFLLEGVAGNRALNLADNIHPNEEGHKVMAKTVYNYVEPLL
jgi:acyl-CoA thioesterase-1